MPGGQVYDLPIHDIQWSFLPVLMSLMLEILLYMIQQVFIQSDVLEVAVDMRLWFDSVPDVLKHVDVLDQSLLCDKDGWLLKNPMGIRTEREIHAESEGANIYRRMYQKYVCI